MLLKNIPVIGEVMLGNPEIYGKLSPDQNISLIIFTDNEDNDYHVDASDINVKLDNSGLLYLNIGEKIIIVEYMEAVDNF